VTRLAYLDCVGGLAGDMLLAALIDAGGDAERVRRLPAALGLDGIQLVLERVERQGLGALHVRFHGAEEQADHRTWKTVRALLEAASLSPAIRERALEAFSLLAEAEGTVHGVPAEEVHFHELGAADTLLDICGVAELMEDLGVDTVACSPLPAAGGVVQAAHGILPLPSPATLELLRGAPLVGAEGGELVTPTGAALAATYVGEWGALPPIVLERIGYGAGTRELANRPNIVRVLLGSSEGAAGSGQVSLLETNLDDLNPELVPDAVERCVAAGALDVWTVPAQMKKGRPGIVLAALARPAHEGAVAAAILEETSALGVRVSRLHRYELEREEHVVEIEGNPVRVKIGRLGGRVVNVAPEHDDCAAVAEAIGTSVKAVWARALAAAQTP
jgi:pyridinium-3,5-bisthiocarboxylic acid mononucleotide nickel chelatase